MLLTDGGKISVERLMITRHDAGKSFRTKTITGSVVDNFRFLGRCFALYFPPSAVSEEVSYWFCPLSITSYALKLPDFGKNPFSVPHSPCQRVISLLSQLIPSLESSLAALSICHDFIFAFTYLLEMVLLRKAPKASFSSQG